VEVVFVKEYERSKGVGYDLFKKVLEFLKENDIKFVSAVIDPNNSRAHHFYEKNGFTKMGLEMQLRFDQ